MFKKATEEEQAAKRREKELKLQQKAEQRAAEARQRIAQAFRSSPAGKARAAFERGNHVFQFSLDVKNTEAIVIPMITATTASKTTDPDEIVNSVCNEGWEPVSASFVFHELGSESRDKFVASGQKIAVKGTVIGYYFLGDARKIAGMFRRLRRSRALRPYPMLRAAKLRAYRQTLWRAEGRNRCSCQRRPMTL